MKNKNEEPKKKPERFEITELFMARAGKKNWDRCFHGTINREKDENGKEIAISGKIKIYEGYIWSRAENQDILGDNLDTLATLVLDYNLHGTAQKDSDIASSPFNHN